MNTTIFPDMSVAPLCFVPFSVTDFVYNPTCYTKPFISNLSHWLDMYIRLNLAVTQALFGLVAQYWLPILYASTCGAITIGIVKILLLQDEEDPLNALESEITQYIYSNASTGCTARMLHEHLYGFYEDREIRMEDVTKSLETLKRRGLVLPVQATLWVTTGK